MENDNIRELRFKTSQSGVGEDVYYCKANGRCYIGKQQTSRILLQCSGSAVQKGTTAVVGVGTKRAHHSAQDSS
jgi:hypothetical protein